MNITYCLVKHKTGGLCVLLHLEDSLYIIASPFGLFDDNRHWKVELMGMLDYDLKSVKLELATDKESFLFKLKNITVLDRIGQISLIPMGKNNYIQVSKPKDLVAIGSNGAPLPNIEEKSITVSIV